MRGRAEAPAAGTILNALANGTGSAFAIDATTRATVELDESNVVTGTVAEDPDADTALIERCVERTLAAHGDSALGGAVRTESDVPMAAGLKSSSAAANATVVATLDALDITLDHSGDGTRDESGGDAVPALDACRIGVEAARDAGVTVTGAFDDASASMLGGVTVTDNRADELLARDTAPWDVLVWTPPERAYSAEADVDRCHLVAPVADVVADRALDGDYGRAMTVNGLAICAALDFPTAPLFEALPDVAGVSVSGTGPSFVAVGDRDVLRDVRSTWDQREGTTWLTTTRSVGCRTR